MISKKTSHFISNTPSINQRSRKTTDIISQNCPKKGHLTAYKNSKAPDAFNKALLCTKSTVKDSQQFDLKALLLS